MYQSIRAKLIVCLMAFTAVSASSMLAGCFSSSSSGDSDNGEEPVTEVPPENNEDENEETPEREGISEYNSKNLTAVTKKTQGMQGDPIPLFADNAFYPFGNQKLVIQNAPRELTVVNARTLSESSVNFDPDVGDEGFVNNLFSRFYRGQPFEHEGYFFVYSMYMDERGEEFDHTKIYYTDGDSHNGVVKNTSGEPLEMTAISGPKDVQSTPDGIIFSNAVSLIPGENGVCLYKAQQKSSGEFVAQENCDALSENLGTNTNSSNNLRGLIYHLGEVYYPVKLAEQADSGWSAYRLERVKVENFPNTANAETVWEFNVDGSITGGIFLGMAELNGEIYSKFDGSEIQRTLYRPSGVPNYEPIYEHEDLCSQSRLSEPLGNREIGDNIVFFARDTVEGEDQFTEDPCNEEEEDYSLAYYNPLSQEVIFNKDNIQGFPFDQLINENNNAVEGLSPFSIDMNVRGEPDRIRPLPYQADGELTKWWGINENAEIRKLRNEAGSVITTARDGDNALAHNVDNYTYLVSEPEDFQNKSDRLYRYDHELGYAKEIDLGNDLKRIYHMEAVGPQLFISGNLHDDENSIVIWRVDDE